nr:hypothetical protein [Tanacetum cinerariifolium]
MWWRLAVVVCRGDEGGGKSDGDDGDDDDGDGVPVYGDDVVVRWWREGVGSSGGCGVACRLGWSEFWLDGGAASQNL